MKYIIVLILFFSILNTPAFALRGCCSHHGGVCGCSCCDGIDLSYKCAKAYGCSTSRAPYQYEYKNNQPSNITTVKGSSNVESGGEVNWFLFISILFIGLSIVAGVVLTIAEFIGKLFTKNSR